MQPPPVVKNVKAKNADQGSLEECLLILLRGMQAHPAIVEESRSREFREKLAALQKTFQGKDNARQVAEAAVAILAQYHALVNEAIASQQAELAKAKAEASGRDPKQEAAQAPLHDALTGLPARAYAEGDLARAFEDTGDCFLAIFAVKRLALINAKFGYARGDQVLLKVVAHLARSLPDFNLFYRWTPCAFLTVAPAGTSFRELRAKVQFIELTRITPTIEWEGHNAMVPVALDCRVLSIKDFSAVSELFLRLDTYAADV
jgi:GGDEF domain-containing protein